MRDSVGGGTVVLRDSVGGGTVVLHLITCPYRYRSNSKVSVTKDKVTSLNSFLKYYFTKTGRSSYCKQVSLGLED